MMKMLCLEAENKFGKVIDPFDKHFWPQLSYENFMSYELVISKRNNGHLLIDSWSNKSYAVIHFKVAERFVIKQKLQKKLVKRKR